MKPVPTFLRVALCIAMAVLCSCATSSSIAPVGWTRIDAIKFTFYVPPNTREAPAQGKDTFVRKYEGNDISFFFSYGWYTDPLEYGHKIDFVERHERIGGKNAKIVSFHNPKSGYPFDEAIAVHFAEVGAPRTGLPKTGLTFFATCRTQAQYKTMRTIFRSIRFK